MARVGSSSRTQAGISGSSVRDRSQITNNDPLSALLYRPMPWPVISPSRPAVLSEVEDNRYWSPRKVSFTIGGLPAKVQRNIGSRSLYANPFKFADASKVISCIRRKQRREVLLAYGRGGGRHRRPRWKASSYWSC